MIVYKATNIFNNKVYIGITTNTLAHRKAIHKRDSKSMNTYFYRAINKYGFNAFKWEIIDTASSLEELMEKEVYWIAKYGSFNDKTKGYNSTSGGGSNYEITDEERQARSKRAKGKNNPMYGVESPMKGKKFTEEHKRKISEALKNAYRPHVIGANNPASRRVLNVDTGEEFNTIKEAREKYPKACKISDVCRGVRKTAGGYRWRYLDL